MQLKTMGFGNKLKKSGKLVIIFKRNVPTKWKCSPTARRCSGGGKGSFSDSVQKSRTVVLQIENPGPLGNVGMARAIY